MTLWLRAPRRRHGIVPFTMEDAGAVRGRGYVSRIYVGTECHTSVLTFKLAATALNLHQARETFDMATLSLLGFDIHAIEISDDGGKDFAHD